MDVAEVYRRALEHRLQEAFADQPGADKPHDIEIPSDESLWGHIVGAVRQLARPVDSEETYFEAELRFAGKTTRHIAFRLQPERRLLVVTCLAGW